jgi:hypothetical protein
LILIFIAPIIAKASLVKPPTSKVTAISSYNHYGNGDITFQITNTVNQCSHGFWFNKSDPGYNANLSMLVAAYQSKTSVRIQAIPELLCKGSKSAYCKLYLIAY